MRVISPLVANVVEPVMPLADVNIYLPNLGQVRTITERLNRLSTGSTDPDRLVLAANNRGEFKMAFESPDVRVETKWADLHNPELANSEELAGQQSNARDASEFSQVRLDGKEWAKVLKVSTLGKKAVACFTDQRAFVLYVFLSDDDEEEAILTYYIPTKSD